MLDAAVQLRAQRDQGIAEELSQSGDGECRAGAMKIAHQCLLVADDLSLGNQSGVHDVSHFVVIQPGGDPDEKSHCLALVLDQELLKTRWLL